MLEYTCLRISLKVSTAVNWGHGFDIRTVLIIAVPAYFQGENRIVKDINARSVAIRCPVCAQPAPSKYEWTFNGAVLPSGVTQSSGQLTIDIFTDRHVGMYTCIVTNRPANNDIRKSFNIELVARGTSVYDNHPYLCS